MKTARIIVAWIGAVLAALAPRRIFSPFFTLSGFALKGGKTRRDGLRRNRRPWLGARISAVIRDAGAALANYNRKLGNVGALNLTWLSLPTVQLSQDRKEYPIDLDPGVPTSEIRLRLTGSITVGATTGSPTINDDGLERLIEKVRVEYDGIPIVRDIPLRDLHNMWLRHVSQEPTQDRITAAELDSAGTYPFELNTGIAFATRWLRRPWDTHLPPLTTKNGLRLIVTFSHDRAGGSATSDKGTGAIVKDIGTDGVFTWGANAPLLQVFQMTHPKQAQNSAPVGVRHYSQFVTDDWAAATALLTEKLKSERSFDMMLFRTVFGATDDLASLINTFSMKSTRETFYDKVPRQILEADEATIFPAVNRQTGYFAIPFARDGMITNLVRPSDHRNLRFEFDTAVPASGTGKIVYTSAEIVRPGEAVS